jgi:hypothetical protein
LKSTGVKRQKQVLPVISSTGAGRQTQAKRFMKTVSLPKTPLTVAKAPPVKQPVQQSPPSPLSQMSEIKVTDIVPNPANPRRYFDDEGLSEPAQNILQHGVLQPVTVREIPEKDGKRYELIFKDFHVKQSNRNSLQKLPETDLPGKIILIDNFEPAPGYIMVAREKETVKPNSENRTVSGTSDKTADPSGSAENPQNPQSPRDGQNAPAVTGANSGIADKPDLMAVLQEKDRKNKEEALMKVIEEARTLIKDTDIPPVEITPFEESLMYYVMLSFLDHRHYELFGIPEGQTLTEEVALGLYTALTGEQKNVLRRDFLIRHLLSRNGISRRSALLIELARHYFPVEMAEIEAVQNDEYQEKWAVIKEQMDKITSERSDLQEVA